MIQYRASWVSERFRTQLLFYGRVLQPRQWCSIQNHFCFRCSGVRGRWRPADIVVLIHNDKHWNYPWSCEPFTVTTIVKHGAVIFKNNRFCKCSRMNFNNKSDSRPHHRVILPYWCVASYHLINGCHCMCEGWAPMHWADRLLRSLTLPDTSHQSLWLHHQPQYNYAIIHSFITQITAQGEAVWFVTHDQDLQVSAYKAGTICQNTVFNTHISNRRDSNWLFPMGLFTFCWHTDNQTRYKSRLWNLNSWISDQIYRCIKSKFTHLWVWGWT